MIEVTQKNRHGTVEIIGQFTDKEFGEEYSPSYIELHFSTNPIMVGSEMRYPSWDVYVGIRIPIFKFVAYNHKGKVLDPTHLIGVSRKYNVRCCWWKYHNSVIRCGFKYGHGGWRKIKTFQERKWNHAWDDEEFCPKVRAQRDGYMLPDPWNNESYIHTEKNWKKFRKHQWKN